MQAAVLRALEFDRIREALASGALTPLGRERALALVPANDPVGGPRGTGADDRSRTLRRRRRVARPPGPGRLAQPRSRFCTSPITRSIRWRFAAWPACSSRSGSYPPSVQRSGGPGLAAIANRAASFADETSAITRAIEPSGDISDRASPALRDIRDALRRQRAKLRSSLDALARGRDTAKYLQDQIVTDRNGRYVVVVRAEHRDAIPGIVHGSSASGASLYLEPLATVASTTTSWRWPSARRPRSIGSCWR